MELLSNSRQLRWLSCSFMLGVATSCSLSCLSNPAAETLQHLSLLDHQLGQYSSGSDGCRAGSGLSGVLTVSPVLRRPPDLPLRAGPALQPSLSCSGFLQLHAGALWSAGIATTSSPPPPVAAAQRRRPGVQIAGGHGHRGRLEGAGKSAAQQLLLLTPAGSDGGSLTLQVRVSANLRVYMMALEVDSSELLRVLKPSLPLERLHLDSYSTLVTDGALELISQQYNRTLTHFLLLRDGPGFPDLSVNRNEDPLVLLAWRCTQLAVLVIHGEFRDRQQVPQPLLQTLPGNRNDLFRVFTLF